MEKITRLETGAYTERVRIIRTWYHYSGVRINNNIIVPRSGRTIIIINRAARDKAVSAVILGCAESTSGARDIIVSSDVNS